MQINWEIVKTSFSQENSYNIWTAIIFECLQTAGTSPLCFNEELNNVANGAAIRSIISFKNLADKPYVGPVDFLASREFKCNNTKD